jgi:hypothetical protein
MLVSFNETNWRFFDKATIAGVCVPIMCKGTTKTCEEESETCSVSGGYCCGGKTPPVMREKLAAAVESI